MATAVIAQTDERTPRGVDKVQRYGWDVQDSPGDFKLIDKKQLIINDEYQREASPTKILELSRNWSWIACGAISVAEREGSYWVVDGQHRLLAARKRSDIRALPCIVFGIEDVAEEAQGFLNANANRKPVNAVAKHRAAVVAGDELAARVQGLLDLLGLTLSGHPKTADQIRCIALIRRRAAEDFRALEQVLTLAVGLARDEEVPVHERLVDGLFYLNRNVEMGLADPRLRKRLKEVGATKLRDAASRAAAYFSRGGAKVFATGMLDALNKGLHRRFSFKGESDQ